VQLGPYEAKYIAPSLSDAPIVQVPTNTPTSSPVEPTESEEEPEPTITRGTTIQPTKSPKNGSYVPTINHQQQQQTQGKPSTPFFPGQVTNSPSGTGSTWKTPSINTLALAKTMDKTLSVPLKTYDTVRYYDTLLQFRLYLLWSRLIELINPVK
jgi:hypothetical protein